MNEVHELIGGLAGLMTTAAFIPQAIMVYKTKNTESISLMMYIVFVTGLVFWIIYGALCGKPAIVIPNVVTFLFASFILIEKIRS